jgi:FkbM family methyltransferase
LFNQATDFTSCRDFFRKFVRGSVDIQLFSEVGKMNHKPYDLWLLAKGDQTLRLDYDLQDDSLVFDVGGYDGNWSNEIFTRYSCKIHIFEPIAEFADNIVKRFVGNPNIFIHWFGLANETKEFPMAILAEGSSIFRQGELMQAIKLVRAIDFINEKQIEKIDLMKINIEGGEYDLLEHLIKVNFIKNINHIQVQFHDFMPDAHTRMIKIQEALKITHYPTYQYRFVWENWRKKDF